MTILPNRFTAALFGLLLGTAGAIHPALADHELQNLDPELAFFLQNNERSFEKASPENREAAEAAIGAMMRFQDSNLLALRLCTERWDGFEGQVEEAQRRIDLVRKAWAILSAFPEDVLAQAAAQSKQSVEGNTQVTDYLLSDLERLNRDCQQALFQLSGALNFARP